MQKTLWVLVFLFFGFGVTLIVFFTFRNDDKTAYKSRVYVNDQKSDTAESLSVNTEPDSLKAKITLLGVPYVSEAPEGNWTGDWVNACEEATIAMVDGFYKNKSTISILEAKTTLQRLFDEQNILYGNSKNADAKQILELITRYASFKAKIKENPTIDELKNEIDSGRPVISLHRGFDLSNPNIPFSPIKSSYHTIVLLGYDDANRQFITHDPGDDKDGENHKYSYSAFMNSLHNYNSKDDKTDGVPTVIFTGEK
jgi:uncharacterized protein YvpB